MRRNDIDRLRILAILLLFPFHTARVFDYWEPNYIKNQALSWTASWLIIAVGTWFMQLLFLISGFSASFALRRRSGRQFVVERIQRLLVPFLLGLLLIVPPQAYLARLQQGTAQGSYWQFLSRFFSDFSDLSGYRGTFTPAHLWFILYLFVISLATLPLLSSRRRQAPPSDDWVGRLLRSPWGLLTMFIPLTLSEALPDLGGKNPFYFALFYLLGFWLARDEQLAKVIDRYKGWTAGVVAAGIAPYILLLRATAGATDFSAGSIALAFLRNLLVWCLLLTLLGYAGKYWRGEGKWLPWLNQAAFPVYVVHQTVMMVIAYSVVQWPMGITGKYLAIMLPTLIGSVGCYELAWRVTLLGIVLGIKPRQSSDVRPVTGSGRST